MAIRVNWGHFGKSVRIELSRLALTSDMGRLVQDIRGHAIEELTEEEDRELERVYRAAMEILRTTPSCPVCGEYEFACLCD
ncbi:MAG: hypothetical protein ETSY1_46660 (plasmid) [Candidatus Entotheonella factor]|uniref:Uncharacterized protein n=1 Tax=Entotheonella factor TaxID=1429438 RepID=W4LZV8_ENTF1|nr:MAG: hypothetical protein ETSY1_46660 [Candidatus Entotheonella factor]